MRKRFVAPLAGAVLIMGFATAANAFSLRLSDGKETVTVTDGVIGDSNALAGVITYMGSVGAYLSNTTVGVSSRILTVTGIPNVPAMDLNSLNIKRASDTLPTTLTLYLTDTGFSCLSPNFTAGIGGTTTGTLKYKTYFSNSNAEFAETNLLTSSSFTGPVFSGLATSLAVGLANPFSLTQEVEITQDIAGGVTSFNGTLADPAADPVPEPGTSVLLGAGLLGLVICGKRRMYNKEA